MQGRANRLGVHAEGVQRACRSEGVIDVVNVLREAGAEVLGIASIFTYNMTKSKENLANANVQNISLSNFDVMVEVAAEEGYIKEDDKQRLIAFRNNPSDESWIK